VFRFSNEEFRTGGGLGADGGSEYLIPRTLKPPMSPGMSLERGHERGDTYAILFGHSGKTGLVGT